MLIIEGLLNLIYLLITIAAIDGIIYPIIADKPLFWRFRQTPNQNMISDLKDKIAKENELSKVYDLQNELELIQTQNIDKVNSIFNMDTENTIQKQEKKEGDKIC